MMVKQGQQLSMACSLGREKGWGSTQQKTNTESQCEVKQATDLLSSADGALVWHRVWIKASGNPPVG